MRKSVFQCAHALVVLSFLGLVGCYAKVEVSDSSAEKAIAIDLVEPPCAEPGSEAGYIEGNGFGAENVTVTVAGIEAEVLAATGMDASFVVPEGIPPGEEIEVVVMNPGGRLATIQWASCEIECSPPDCDDGNECTTDTCDTSDGTCINDPVAGGTLCGTDGVCESGACRERSWGTPVPIARDDTGDTDNPPQLAADVNGNVIAVWSQYIRGVLDYSIWSNRYMTGVGWGVAERIEQNSRELLDPKVAIDVGGNATAAWTSYPIPSTIWSERYTPGGGWGAAESIGSTGDPQPNVGVELVVDPDGNATVVWEDDDLSHNRYTPGIGWGVAGSIPNSGSGQAPQLAVDADGNVTTVWYRQEQGDDADIWSSRYTPGVGWGPAEPIDADEGRCLLPQIAVDGAGYATAVWVKSYTPGQGPWYVWSRRYAPGVGWGPAEKIEPDHLGYGADEVQVAAGVNGDVTAVWRKHDTEFSIWANSYAPGIGWGAAVLIETNMGFADLPQVAVDPNGNATAVWTQGDGQGGSSIWANRYNPSADWGTAVVIQNDTGNSIHAQVAVDPAGRATAIWIQGDGRNIWSNRFE